MRWISANTNWQCQLPEKMLAMCVSANHLICCNIIFSLCLFMCMVWLGLVTETTWIGSEEEHVLASLVLWQLMRLESSQHLDQKSGGLHAYRCRVGPTRQDAMFAVKIAGPNLTFRSKRGISCCHYMPIDFHIRRWRGRRWCYHVPNRLPDSILRFESHQCIFVKNLGIFPVVFFVLFCFFGAIKTSYFSQIVGPFSCVIVASKTGIFSQTMMFS